VPPADAPVCTTPGRERRQAREVVAGKRQVLDLPLVIALDRSPLCVCTIGDSARRSPFRRARPFEHERRNADAVAAVTATPAGRTVLNDSSVISTCRCPLTFGKNVVAFHW